VIGVIVSIHQPNYLPYIGFFQKMALSDVFVLLDTVQFSRSSFTQRTRIRTKDSSMWLTIPVEKKEYFKLINETLLPDDRKWLKKHKTSIVANYSKCKCFDSYFVNDYYSDSEKYTDLQKFNEYGIFYLKKKLGIRTDIVWASELDLRPELRSTELLIDILETLGADTYISGLGGKKYMDESQFSMKNIGLKYLEFKPFPYPQRWEGFGPYMSALDLVFNLDSGMFFQEMSKLDCLR